MQGQPSIAADADNFSTVVIARVALWRGFFGSPPQGLYESLLRQASAQDSPQRQQVAKQVGKDVNRTWGSVAGLRVPPAEARRSLRNVLLAYSERNPQVGYCRTLLLLPRVLPCPGVSPTPALPLV